MAQLQTMFDNFLNEKNFFTDLLEKVEKKTGVKKSYLFIALVALVGIYLIIGYGAALLCNFIGFLYPAYHSPNKDDDTQWLIYWVVYGFFCVVEFFSDIFLDWFPLYYFSKCVFLVWCMAPVQWNGSQKLYNGFIRPIFLRHEKAFDNMVDQFGNRAREFKDTFSKEAKKAAANYVTKSDKDS
uniref:Receptor expression-enhancing protein n=1 Tax=Eptatretus burgeri TaxID=7764 RepID=A0A8C4NI82_EPTBU